MNKNYKSKSIATVLLRLFRGVSIFTSILAISFSPLVDRATPYLPIKVARNLEIKQAYAALDRRIFIVVASGSLSGVDSSGNWTVPADWNNASNSIEVIGAGGGGGDGAATQGSGGGGGGGYGKIVNLSFAAGSTSIPFSVGASGSGGATGGNDGGNGGHTWFGKSTFTLCTSAGTAVCVSAEGGEGGKGSGGNFSVRALGGSTASGSATTEFGGGDGGTGKSGGDASGGGGGAGGPYNNGGHGGNDLGLSTTNEGGGGGGAADNGFGNPGSGSHGLAATGGAGGTGPGGAGGAGGNGSCGGAGDGGNASNAGSGGGGGDTGCKGGNGANGNEFDAVHGAGGGGGGGGDNGITSGGSAGDYGGGGGGNAICTAVLCRGGDGIIVITYRPTSTFTQSAFRFFENANANQIGGPLANTNASASINTSSGVFRLRLAIDVGTADLSQSGQAFKLQTAKKGAGTCASPDAPYVEVTTTSSISYNDNTTPADNDSMYSNGLDPQGTGTQIDQSYEELNNFTNGVQAINNGQHGLWDFSLKDNTAADGVAFCFRAVKSTDAMITYSNYPEIRMFSTITTTTAISQTGAGGGGSAGGVSGGGTPPGGGTISGGGGGSSSGSSGGGTPPGGGTVSGGGGGASPVLYTLLTSFDLPTQIDETTPSTIMDRSYGNTF